MENLNLIRKITWSFHKTSGVDWEELFGEACLAYVEALNKYDSNKMHVGCSTYFYKCITNRLIWFLQKENRNKFVELDSTYEGYSTNQVPFFELFDSLSNDSKIIAKLILEDPHTFLEVPGKMARGLVSKKLLHDFNWTWERIRIGIKNMKKELVENS